MSKFQIDEETITAMVDNGATRNFISLREPLRISLKVVPIKIRFKVANSST